MLRQEQATGDRCSQSAHDAEEGRQLYEPLGHLRVAAYHLNQVVTTILPIGRKEEATDGCSDSLPGLLQTGLSFWSLRLRDRCSGHSEDMERLQNSLVY
jgi:hypothetical protein